MATHAYGSKKTGERPADGSPSSEPEIYGHPDDAKRVVIPAEEGIVNLGAIPPRANTAPPGSRGKYKKLSEAERKRRKRERQAKRIIDIEEPNSHKAVTASQVDLTQILFSAHMMMAAIAKAPAWAITEDESAKLAKAIDDVAQHYEMPLLDEKGRAWLALSMVGCEVYGTRVASAIIERKQRQPKPAQASVTPIRQTQAANSTPAGVPTTVEQTFPGA
jgi:hypothetical protein